MKHMESIRNILQDWSETTDSRAKLQQAYLATALGMLVLAGVVGLVNYGLGQQMMLLALVAGAIFIINSVAWALLQSFILLHLESRRVREYRDEIGEADRADEEPKKAAVKPVKTVNTPTVKESPAKTTKKTKTTKSK